MNWVSVATIVAVIVMVALGAYFLVWMTRSQKAAAAQYQEQMRAAAAAEARALEEPAEARPPDETDAANTAGGGGLSDADRLKFQEQHRSSGSV